MTGELYAEIIDTQLIPFIRTKLDSDPVDWIIVEDNDKKHTSRDAIEMRNYHGLDRLDWPSQSPDMNPIENL